MRGRTRAEHPLRCPSCDHAALSPGPLEAGLTAYTCLTCEGHWLASEDYRVWLGNRHDPEAPERSNGRALAISDVQHARLCPSCRRIMLRYRVGRGTDFSIDLCDCGIWFDRNEWLALKDRSLHDDLHLVGTEPWQAEVRREEAREHLESLYKKRYGAEYDEVLRVRGWLAEHPQRDSILAFLSDPDPFWV